MGRIQDFKDGGSRYGPLQAFPCRGPGTFSPVKLSCQLVTECLIFQLGEFDRIPLRSAPGRDPVKIRSQLYASQGLGLSTLEQLGRFQVV